MAKRIKKAEEVTEFDVLARKLAKATPSGTRKIIEGVIAQNFERKPKASKKTTAKPVESKKLADAMLGLVAAYLQEKGWCVVVIGDARVQKQPGDAEFNYEFVLRFTGGPPKDGTATVAPAGGENGGEL